MPFTGDYDGSIVAVLERLRDIAGVEGLALLDLSDTEQPVLFALGPGGHATVTHGRDLLLADPIRPSHTLAADGRAILACPWMLPPDRPGGLALWRAAGARRWEDGDHSLAATVAMLLHVLLCSGLGQVGIDRLTGVPNRRWFLDEADRHIERLDGDGAVGTLSLIEIDNLTRLAVSLGRTHVDRVLVRLASYLRTMVRPGDVVARIAVDEFALWQTGMDHLTAAERAESLCLQPMFQELPDGHRASLSIGIASRPIGSGEDVRTLLRRAQLAVRDLKAIGGGGWRVSHLPAKPRCSQPKE
ncbi:GGDEF domain-containing protein [Rhodopila globiformis]|uniref:GGDEF domain-containing protein n=1 Tax=Rhodopila globiformis TaxID=1071 RepID=UPI0011B0E133|nr:GGDEF domain-containing protein [Rhodopila globiformis]